MFFYASRTLEITFSFEPDHNGHLLTGESLYYTALILGVTTANKSSETYNRRLPNVTPRGLYLRSLCLPRHNPLSILFSTSL